jgi:hypothetical protein
MENVPDVLGVGRRNIPAPKDVYIVACNKNALIAVVSLEGSASVNNVHVNATTKEIVVVEIVRNAVEILHVLNAERTLTTVIMECVNVGVNLLAPRYMLTTVIMERVNVDLTPNALVINNV